MGFLRARLSLIGERGNVIVMCVCVSDPYTRMHVLLKLQKMAVFADSLAAHTF